MSHAVPPADEPIRDFVRSRMDVPIPPSLTDEVMRAIAAGANTGTSRFSPMFAGISAIVVTAALFAGALWVTGPRNVGPDPVPAPSAAPTPTPAPTLTPEDELSLTEPGDVVRIAAQDDQGVYGTIVIERGEESAGYPGTEMQLIWPESFFIEVHISYEIDRATRHPYGYDDWGFHLTEPTSEGDMTKAYISYEFDPGHLTLLPRRDEGSTPIEGWVVVALPSDAAEVPVTLAYRDPTTPQGDEVVPYAEIPLRDPGPPVGTVAMPTPPPGAPTGPIPMPSPSPHPDADDLFEESEECVSENGYSVNFPAAWYTNAAVPGLPACSWFAPVPFSVDGVDEPPVEVAIVIEARRGDAIEPDDFEYLGAFGGGIGGLRAWWWERESIDSELIASGERILYYEVLLDGESPLLEPNVEWLYAATTTENAADDAEYERNKAVLHRIMASMEIRDR